MEGYIGQIIMFGGNFAPRSWAFCDGQLLSIAQNTALFSIIGTIYGGDGRTTFALPDLRGRAPIHAGNGPGLSDRRLGSKGGQETHTLAVAEIPSHNHSVSLHAERGLPTTTDPANNMISQHAAGNNAFKPYDANEDKAMATQSIRQSNVGGNQSHNNMQPYLTVNYIICLQGIFPSRS